MRSCAQCFGWAATEDPACVPDSGSIAGYLEWAIKLILCHIEQGLVVIGPRYIASCILQSKQATNL